MSSSRPRQGRSQLPISTILALALATATTASVLERRQGMSVGSSCAGSEGQWNCMTGSFQRCGAGQWSEVQQCALGTRCSPSGLTYQFHVDFADGYLGAAPPPTSGAPLRIEGGWWLLCGLGLLAAAV